MEKLSQKLANKLSCELQFDDEKKEVVAYGLMAFGQAVLTLILVVVIGFLAGVLVEALIISISVSLLRKYSGGAHLSYMWLCTIVGVIYSVAAAAVSRYLLSPHLTVYFIFVILTAVFAASYFIVYKYAPVASPLKPIKTAKKIRRMRQGSFITLSVMFILSVLSLISGIKHPLFNGYAISLIFGILWQIFTLTTFGAQFFHILDHVGSKILRSEWR